MSFIFFCVAGETLDGVGFVDVLLIVVTSLQM
jgi:hypothetical protein